MGARRESYRVKVVHRHRLAGKTFCCVSELTYLGDAPYAILYWINSSGIKTPITVPLESKKLVQAAGNRHLWFYRGVTLDPRYVDIADGRTLSS